jgi:hypothetical protein
MVKFKIKFICLILFALPAFAGKQQCQTLSKEIGRIQTIQNKHKAFGTTVKDIQKSYDQNMAQLILLKGLKEIKDDYWRAKGNLKISSVDKDKVLELQKKLEEGIKTSSKLLAMDDLLEESGGKRKPLENEFSSEFLDKIKKGCKGKGSELCSDLKKRERYPSMVRGFSTTFKIANGKNPKALGKLKEDLREGLPSKEKIKDELSLEREISRDIKRLNRCLAKGDACGPELSLIKDKVKQMNQALDEDEALQENSRRIALEDKFGDLETLINTLELEKRKEQGNISKKQKETLKNLNKRVKKNFEVANIRAKIRGEKFNPKEPPEVTDKSAKNIYKGLFKKLGCKKINQCLEKLGPGKSKLEKQIAKVEDKIDATKVNLDKVSANDEYKNLDEMKALLVAMAADECHEVKTEKGHPGFIKCDFDIKKASPHYKVNKFAFQIGRVMAEVDKDLFVDEFTDKKEKEKKLKKLCKKDYDMRASAGKSSAFCYSMFPDLKKKKLSKRISEGYNNLFLSDEEKIMKKCGPAKRCFDWIAFWETYDVTRDETGKGVAVEKIPTWSELIAPNLAKSVNTLLPVGLEMYTSDYYLKEMQNQAAHQMEVNYYRENWPIHTHFWDHGYRGFTDGYVGGPTPENPGVTGIGAIGNPYAGIGAWNPYGLSGSLYNFNPYYFGNFQNGNTFTHQQLQY